ncbi:hypothetical protein VNO78_07948 [Psophocarpus tetragonolobus]|uniref:Uncharacterized protein n=1 Tax=Psophocarpus tetragonolobus TaxID=3891 RepID=A0AAN9SX04_PSOTE
MTLTLMALTIWERRSGGFMDLLVSMVLLLVPVLNCMTFSISHFLREGNRVTTVLAKCVALSSQHTHKQKKLMHDTEKLGEYGSWVGNAKNYGVLRPVAERHQKFWGVDENAPNCMASILRLLPTSMLHPGNSLGAVLFASRNLTNL